ncbi:MAG: EF-hand domain-containing protein [Sphingomonas sp.]|nr:EF-hand domain-containing protein [Sphingomonas sp.]
MNKWILGPAIAATLIAGTAIAQQLPAGGKPHGWARMLAKVDANKDGAVSLDETLAAAKARFAKHDANGDGKISEQEATAWRQQHHDRKMARGGPEGGRRGWGGPGGPGGPGGMLMRLDADRDGKLTRAEFDMPFDRIDSNRDSVVDATEMQAARQMMQQRMRDRTGLDPQ